MNWKLQVELWLLFKRWEVERNLSWFKLWLQAVNPFDPLFSLEDFRACRRFAVKKK